MDGPLGINGVTATKLAVVQRAVDLGALLGKKPASALAVRRALGLPLRA